MVKQRYGTELRSRTLAYKKPEISQALSSLLDEIHTADEAKILRAEVSNYCKSGNSKQSFKQNLRSSKAVRVCPLCKQAGRSDSNHFLSECSFLPEQDRKYMVRARQIAEILDVDEHMLLNSPLAPVPKCEEGSSTSLKAYRVQT